ncbi:MAG: radical SAM protein, partial [Actinobacteria bacterium]|nr:radical SAM protein [Actinomycetota bacterium]
VVRSAEVKERNPLSITVHGGPNTPKYDDDIQQFFRMNPQVDVTVHGEGEASLVHLLDVLADSLAAGRPDLSLLHDVPGISFRLGDEVFHTAKRDRIADLDTIPSPYDTGLFDSIGDNEITLMTVETNRGCPYGCTYCDWGSATLSRIRQFDQERVYRELEWCARHKVAIIFNADANFGIFARDVEIARKLVELKKQYGYPKVFESSYAKNTVKHLREIIEILADGEILSTGTLSLQSMDPGTLDAIHRSNIKVEKYDDLAVEFSKRGLPLVIELMMGLPGSTMASYLGDLQQCIDREVKARVNPTEVLMNSPMNDPEYRAEHQIDTLRPVNQDWSEHNRTRKKALVVSTTTFSREEYEQMERIRLSFLLFENFAVGRLFSRFVRQETGCREIDLYVKLVEETRADPTRWPAIAFVLEVIVEYMVPPASWTLFFDELRDFLVTRMGVADDSALQAVLRAQLAVIPSRERAFPETVELEHDVPAWQAAVLAAKRDHADDWTQVVPRLASFGPTSFAVDDPQSVAVLGLGMALVYDPDSDWELASPMARPMRFRHTFQT